jgi:hypothetical protein
MSVLLFLGSGMLLTGCAGALPSKPLPDWAMHRAPASKKVTERRERAVLLPATMTGSNLMERYARIGNTADAADEVAPFTPAWYAREQAVDAKLRQVMKICRGC